MVVTGDITQVDLPREQQSGLIVVGDVLDAVEGIEFVRFGGEDVVRHKLVQRIVEAYDVHAQRRGARARARPTAAPERRCSRSRSSAPSACDVGARRDCRCPPEEVAGCARSRPAAAGVGDGHVAIEFVDEPRIAELNARHRGKAEPTDVLSFPIDGRADAAAGRSASWATS